ncbi:GmrSD restriction endonuclease domain-containing protein [Demequina iriomotensis]|uniref:GmrSD restriction endonuclease domain-containing protein n=1 Tax=Demequina iriomotensis TaxID=1536641 RepID=UPI0009E29582|nr:DUF1524 domain-containing protein [Demequina iriomotensis]
MAAVTRPRRIVLLAAAAALLAACAGPADTGTLPGVPSATASPSATVTAAPAPGESAVASASAAPSASPTASRITQGTAYNAALALTVKGRAAKTGYSREEFGAAWADVDHNGCDTRNDMLQLRLTDTVLDGACTVLSGDLDDPYTGTLIRFERGGASEVDIDHMVALSDAWQKGASRWPYAKRVALANDPLNLEPVDAGANRQKGDADAASWLPSHKAYRCEYVARQVAVKTKYGLWVTQAELEAMLLVLDTCPEQALPEPGDQPVIATGVGDGPQPAESAEPAPRKTEAPAASSTDPQFPYCKDAIAAGYGPYVQGEDPEYAWYRDGDSDGIVCER